MEHLVGSLNNVPVYLFVPEKRLPAGRQVLCSILHHAFRWNAVQHYAVYATHQMFRWNEEADILQLFKSAILYKRRCCAYSQSTAYGQQLKGKPFCCWRICGLRVFVSLASALGV